MPKTSIKSQGQGEYKFVKYVIIPIDTDTAGRRHPRMSTLDNVIAETIQDAKYFRIEGIKTSESEYSIRIYGSKDKK